MKIAKLRDALIPLLIVGMLSSLAQAEPAKLTEIAITATPTKARININFNKLPGYKVFALTHPARVVIDLQDTAINVNLNKLNLTVTPLTSIRSGPQPGNNTRLVIDLKNTTSPPSFSTSADADQSRLTVEVGGHLAAPKSAPTVVKPVEKPTAPLAKEEVKATPKEVKFVADVPAIDDKNIKINQISEEKEFKNRISKDAAPADPIPPLTKKEPISLVKPALITPEKITVAQVAPRRTIVQPAPKKRLIEKAAQSRSKTVNRANRDVVILIDPGHGGKDPGARGANGSSEKHIVLAISKKLQQLIEQEPGMQAVLTRKGDYFVTLRDRLRIARKDKADLFVAIHADAFNNPQSSGASVFALSANGASSEAARWLAEKENYSELGGISLTDKSDVLRSVLIDLSQTGIISLSLQLGSDILRNLGKVAHLHHSRVEQARFVVLKSLDIPSVLVETGFISNGNEEERLNDPAYQQQIAESMFKGIRNYFKQYPPPGTRLAADKDTGESTVVENKTLEKALHIG